MFVKIIRRMVLDVVEHRHADVCFEFGKCIGTDKVAGAEQTLDGYPQAYSCDSEPLQRSPGSGAVGVVLCQSVYNQSQEVWPDCRVYRPCQRYKKDNKKTPRLICQEFPDKENEIFERFLICRSFHFYMYIN